MEKSRGSDTGPRARCGELTLTAGSSDGRVRGCGLQRTDFERVQGMLISSDHGQLRLSLGLHLAHSRPWGYASSHRRGIADSIAKQLPPVVANSAVDGDDLLDPGPDMVGDVRLAYGRALELRRVPDRAASACGDFHDGRLDRASRRCRRDDGPQRGLLP